MRNYDAQSDDKKNEHRIWAMFWLIADFFEKERWLQKVLDEYPETKAQVEMYRLRKSRGYMSARLLAPSHTDEESDALWSMIK